jgi:ribosomal protein S18 acetylase RimI-like enzyme
VAAYSRRERKPRLEYVPSLAPEVEPALLARGFEVEGRLPLMTYEGAGADAPTPDGIELVEARSDDELRGVATVQWEAYGETGELPQRVVEGLRRTVEAGGVAVLARDGATKEAAGGGLCTGPYEATELTSIGVRNSFRRRGIAEAMARRLAREMHSRGNDGVFLMAAGEREARIYERAGFTTVSEILHISAA